LAIKDDSSYGAYYGTNGNQTTNRGGLRFNTAKSESGDGPPVATVNGYPNNGFMVYIDGGVNSTVNDIAFNNFIDQIGSYRQRIAWVKNTSRGIVFNNPAGSNTSFDNGVNPGQAAFVDYSQIVSGVGSNLKVVWGPGAVTHTDSMGLVVGVDGLISTQYNPALLDAFTVNSEREANGYVSIQAQQWGGSSNKAYRARLWGDTYDRWIVDSFGNMRWGTGSGAQDVGACRSGVGSLSVSDGSTTCDANGSLYAASFIGALTGNASTASNLSGTPALPNGTTATEQSAASADGKVATDSYADRAATNAAAAVTLAGLGGVPTSRTVNGHALSSNVTISASDLTTGTLPHAQLPTLFSGDIPANAANTSGNAATASAVPWAGLTGTVPTFNQSTTGSAASLTRIMGTTATVALGVSTPVYTFNSCYPYACVYQFIAVTNGMDFSDWGTLDNVICGSVNCIVFNIGKGTYGPTLTASGFVISVSQSTIGTSYFNYIFTRTN
jgi:hypothetical protein